MEYKTIADNVVRQCLKKGAQAAEAYLESSRRLSVSVRNGEVETVQENQAQGVGIRVLVNGRMGFAHSNDLSEQSLNMAVASAVDFAKILTADKHNGLPSEGGFSPVDGLYDDNIQSISMDRKIRMATQAEALAIKDRGITKSAGASYSENEKTVFLANSNGVSQNYRSASCGFGVSVVAEKGDQKCSGGEYCTRRYVADLESIEKVAGEAARKAWRMLDPRPVKTQRAAVIFDASAARSVLGGVLGALNGERVVQGTSFLGDKMDQAIGAECMTLVDDGLRSRGLGSAPFDGEGVATQKRTLVEKGVVKGFLYNTIAANRAGTKSTGNASRGGYTALPGIGTHNFYMEGGKQSPKAIISATKRGLLVTGVTGYGINPVSGNFSGGVSGFWIENGRIQHPVKGLTIAGTAQDILFAMDMVGNDLDLNRSFAAPTFRIREMLIGGE